MHQVAQKLTIVTSLGCRRSGCDSPARSGSRRGRSDRLAVEPGAWNKVAGVGQPAATASVARTAPHKMPTTAAATGSRSQRSSVRPLDDRDLRRYDLERLELTGAALGVLLGLASAHRKVDRVATIGPVDDQRRRGIPLARCQIDGGYPEPNRIASSELIAHRAVEGNFVTEGVDEVAAHDQPTPTRWCLPRENRQGDFRLLDRWEERAAADGREVGVEPACRLPDKTL